MCKTPLPTRLTLTHGRDRTQNKSMRRTACSAHHRHQLIEHSPTPASRRAQSQGLSPHCVSSSDARAHPTSRTWPSANSTDARRRAALLLIPHRSGALPTTRRGHAPLSLSRAFLHRNTALSFVPRYSPRISISRNLRSQSLLPVPIHRHYFHFSCEYVNSWCGMSLLQMINTVSPFLSWLFLVTL